MAFPRTVCPWGTLLDRCTVIRVYRHTSPPPPSPKSFEALEALLIKNAWKKGLELGEVKTEGEGKFYVIF